MAALALVNMLKEITQIILILQEIETEYHPGITLFSSLLIIRGVKPNQVLNTFYGHDEEMKMLSLSVRT